MKSNLFLLLVVLVLSLVAVGVASAESWQPLGGIWDWKYDFKFSSDHRNMIRAHEGVVFLPYGAL